MKVAMFIAGFLMVVGASFKNANSVEVFIYYASACFLMAFPIIYK